MGQAQPSPLFTFHLPPNHPSKETLPRLHDFHTLLRVPGLFLWFVFLAIDLIPDNAWYLRTARLSWRAPAQLPSPPALHLPPSRPGLLTPPPPLPMANYDKGPAGDVSAGAAAPEKAQDRRDSTGQTAPRQQLPSLSSLFGPPSSLRSLRTPTDRDGAYPAHSPLDRPRASPGVGNSSLNSYFPAATSPPFHSLAAPTMKWSVHHDAGRHEYSLGSRDVSFRSPGDPARGHFSGSKDSGLEFSEPRPIHGSSNPPPTPSSTVTSEGMPSKDGLGPKIWTGTHFLPRFVRAAEVPGEGMCYFYDDGSHCKTVIDGEAVNAHWGVTKAGKPRKRLAIACVTCREKKIKCDPDYPRCVQCEKFGRVCKFKNAPRGGHNTSPSTPPAELDDAHRLGGRSRHHDGRISESGSSPPVSPRAESSPDGGYSKRLKVGPESYVPNGEPVMSSSRPLDHSKATPQPLHRPPPEILPRIPDEVLSRAWSTDPYGSDPESINLPILGLLPPREKTAEDLMVLYSVLAIGVALSGGPKHIAYEYAQVAYFAQKMTTTACLQLVQSRILLAVYHISTSRPREAAELISSAAATAACLQLNRELEKPRDELLSAYPFGMNGIGYCEARRRTMWSLFMLERLNTLLPDRPIMIHAEDIYVRLPADSESFEKQVEAVVPMFDPDESIVSKLAEKSSEITGYLIEMTHIWSTCQTAISRLASRTTASEVDLARAQTISRRAREWHNSLPSRLMFGGSNLESAAFSGKVGSFLTMHLLYHHTVIGLNRYHLGAARLPTDGRAKYLQECREHAMAILDITNCLDRILRVRPTILSTPPPAMSMAITVAVDVLTASGSMASINELIQSIRVAKTAVDSMGKVWEHSLVAKEAIEQRLQKLTQIYHNQGSRPSSPTEGYRVVQSSEEPLDPRRLQWQIPEPIEKPYPMDMDIVYSTLA
ncbi:hypothetical protein ACCO45_008389 [Purpureocillium lilacinum]|uniref:Uncharacterized protein n=1 Tax=Purpureocillium lilacinum TaxID=33203 RepID=A0ACC4DN56_PURLI